MAQDTKTKIEAKKDGGVELQITPLSPVAQESTPMVHQELLQTKTRTSLEVRVDDLEGHVRRLSALVQPETPPVLLYDFLPTTRLRYPPRPIEGDPDAFFAMEDQQKGDENTPLRGWSVRFSPVDGLEIRLAQDEERWLPTGLIVAGPLGDMLILSREVEPPICKELLRPLLLIRGNAAAELIVPVRNTRKNSFLLLRPGEELAQVSLTSGRAFRVVHKIKRAPTPPTQPA